VLQICLRKLPGWNTLHEHNIQLLKCAILRLRQTEPSPNSRDSRQTSPEESSLALKIPLRGIHHIRLQYTTDDVTNIVSRTTEHDSLGTQTSGTDLSDDRVDNWSDCHTVGAEPDETERCLDVFDRLRVINAGNAGQDTNDEEARYHAQEPSEEDRTTSNSVHDEPRDDSSAESDSSAAQTDAVRHICINTGLLEEIGRAVSECATVGDLGQESETGDLGTAEVGSFEAVPVRCAKLFLFFETGRVNHECNGGFVVDVV